MYNSQNSQHNAEQTYTNVHFNTYYSMTPQVSTYNANYNWNMYYNAYPSHVMHDNIINNTALVDKSKVRQKDEITIEQFLQQNEQVSIKRKRKNPFKIAALKSALISVVKLNKKLETICTELNVNVDLLEEQWQEKVTACNIAKHEICEILKSIKDTDFLHQIKNNLEKRKKKRKREQLRKEKWKKEKLMTEERKARLHAVADSWIRKEQTVLEREKQEEKLRKDADMILSDVHSKRNDVRKYLGILQDLQNLRRIKMNVARARGENWSLSADEDFNNSIAKLMKHWTNLDREYIIEEQKLKHTLETDNEKRIEKQTKNLYEDWENVLFGTNMLITEQSHIKDVNNFITIRMAWDKFTSSENDATTIPIGWIVPEKPSSAAWQKCLNKETS